MGQATCPVCGSGLELLADFERQVHVNACIEKRAQRRNREESSATERCGICGKELVHVPIHGRVAHVQRCSSADGQVVASPPRKKRTRRRTVTKNAAQGEVDEELDGFLRSVGLGRYSAGLTKEGVDLAALRLLSDSELARLKLPTAARKRISDAIPRIAQAKLAATVASAADPVENICSDDEVLIITQTMTESHLRNGSLDAPKTSLWAFSNSLSPGPDEPGDDMPLDKLLEGGALEEQRVGGKEVAEVDIIEITSAATAVGEATAHTESTGSSRTVEHGISGGAGEQRRTEARSPSRGRRKEGSAAQAACTTTTSMTDKTAAGGEIVTIVEVHDSGGSSAGPGSARQVPGEKEHPEQAAGTTTTSTADNTAAGGEIVTILEAHDSGGSSAGPRSAHQVPGEKEHPEQSATASTSKADEAPEHDEVVAVFEDGGSGDSQAATPSQDVGVEETLQFEKRWAGYSDEDICAVLRGSDFYVNIVSRDHVDFDRFHSYLKDSGVQLPKTVLCRFLRDQGVGWRN